MASCRAATTRRSRRSRRPTVPTTATSPGPGARTARVPGARSPTATSPGSSTRSGTSSRSRARSRSRPSPTTEPRTPSPARRSMWGRLRGGRPAPGPGGGAGHQRQDRRAGDDRTDGLPRAAAGRDPGHARGPAPDPGGGTQDRPPGRGRGWGSRTSAGLRQAAEEGRLRSLRGISAGTEQRILEGIAQLASRPTRMLLDRAQALSDGLVAQLEGTEGVTRIVQAGSLRRRRETIGDLDLLVETDRPEAVIERFTHLGAVDRVLGAGTAKAAVTLLRGPQVDLMVMPPGEAGTYLVHFTGLGRPQHPPPGHRPRPWLEPVREGLPAPRRRRRAARRRRGRAPNLPRRGRRLRLPRPVLDPAGAARGPGRDRGGARWPPAGPDHAGGPPRRPPQPLRVERRRPFDRGHGGGGPAARLRLPGPHRPLAEPGDRARPGPGARGAAADDHRRSQRPVRGGGGGGRAARWRRVPAGSGCSTAASWRSARTARWTTRTTSSRGSTSSSPRSTSARRQPREELTRRTLNAIRSPHVDVIAHPAGRMIQARDDLDLDWDAVFDAAAATGTALEINGSPHRLDLAPERARRAVEAGCILSIDSDAHRTEELEYVRWGVDQARRAWVERAPRPQHAFSRGSAGLGGRQARSRLSLPDVPSPAMPARDAARHARPPGARARRDHPRRPHPPRGASRTPSCSRASSRSRCCSPGPRSCGRTTRPGARSRPC